jgi:hypothetical protein
MISKRRLIKLIAVLVIAGIGALYWYYAERRSSPIEEVERTIQNQP